MPTYNLLVAGLTPALLHQSQGEGGADSDPTEDSGREDEEARTRDPLPGSPGVRARGSRVHITGAGAGASLMTGSVTVITVRAGAGTGAEGAASGADTTRSLTRAGAATGAGLTEGAAAPDPAEDGTEHGALGCGGVAGRAGPGVGATGNMSLLVSRNLSARQVITNM